MNKFLMLMFATFVMFTAYAGNDEAGKKEKSTSDAIEKVSVVGISGSIIDNENNELLAGATIYIDGNKYYSDLNGNFSVSHLKPGKHLIRVEFISYQSSEIEVDINNNKKVDIVLNQQ